MPTPSPARPAWLDYAWGIAVLLVALGYSMLPELLLDVVFIFTWPLVFFLAGFESGARPRSSGRHLIRQRARQLLLPYAGYSLLAWCLWLAWGALGLLEAPPQEPALALWGTVVATPRGALLAHARPLWALPALFVIETLTHPLDPTRWRPAWLAAATLAAWLVGWGMWLLGLTGLPWSLHALPTLGACFLLGRQAAGWRLLRGSPSRLIASLLQYAFAAVVFAAAAWNGRADAALADWGRSYPLFTLGALAGIGAAYARAASIDGLRIAAWAGRRWLALLGGCYPAVLLMGAAVRACGATCEIPAWAAALVGLAQGVLAVGLVAALVQLGRARPWSPLASRKLALS